MPKGKTRSGINLDELRAAIRRMNRWDPLYLVLKKELSALGYWRNKPRGDPAKGYDKAKTTLGGG